MGYGNGAKERYGIKTSEKLSLEQNTGSQQGDRDGRQIRCQFIVCSSALDEWRGKVKEQDKLEEAKVKF